MYALAFDLQLRKKHGKTSVRVVPSWKTLSALIDFFHDLALFNLGMIIFNASEVTVHVPRAEEVMI